MSVPDGAIVWVRLRIQQGMIAEIQLSTNTEVSETQRAQLNEGLGYRRERIPDGEYTAWLSRSKTDPEQILPWMATPEKLGSLYLPIIIWIRKRILRPLQEGRTISGWYSDGFRYTFPNDRW